MKWNTYNLTIVIASHSSRTSDIAWPLKCSHKGNSPPHSRALQQIHPEKIHPISHFHTQAENLHSKSIIFSVYMIGIKGLNLKSEDDAENRERQRRNTQTSTVRVTGERASLDVEGREGEER